MFAWSFSQLSQYRTCPKRWYHYYIAKDFREAESDQMRWGFQVHAAMAARIEDNKKLPETMEVYERWIDWVFTNDDCDIGVENKMAITEEFEPCAYFSKTKPVWFRTVLDVVKQRDVVARIVDWKTGKVPENPVKRAEAEQQLWLSATVMFAHFPRLKLVRTHLVYLQEDKPEDISYRDIMRTDLPALWQEVTPVLARMQYSLDKSEFPPNPSGLCKRHCAVASCSYYGKGPR
jgi:RecB family exonuclease